MYIQQSNYKLSYEDELYDREIEYGYNIEGIDDWTGDPSKNSIKGFSLEFDKEVAFKDNKLLRLKELYDNRMITDKEYDIEKRKIVNEFKHNIEEIRKRYLNKNISGTLADLIEAGVGTILKIPFGILSTPGALVGAHRNLFDSKNKYDDRNDIRDSGATNRKELVKYRKNKIKKQLNNIKEYY